MQAARTEAPTMSSSTPTLPSELWYYIIDIVACASDRDTLLSCALAYRPLTPRCRFHLLGSIYLRTVQQLQRFEWTLARYRDVRLLVSKLILCPTDDATDLLEMCLKLIPQLPSLTTFGLIQVRSRPATAALPPRRDLMRSMVEWITEPRRAQQVSAMYFQTPQLSSTYTSITSLSICNNVHVQFDQLLDVLSSFPDLSELHICSQCWAQPRKPGPTLGKQPDVQLKKLQYLHYNAEHSNGPTLIYLLSIISPCLQKLTIHTTRSSFTPPWKIDLSKFGALRAVSLGSEYHPHFDVYSHIADALTTVSSDSLENVTIRIPSNGLVHFDRRQFEQKNLRPLEQVLLRPQFSRISDVCFVVMDETTGDKWFTSIAVRLPRLSARGLIRLKLIPVGGSVHPL